MGKKVRASQAQCRPIGEDNDRYLFSQAVSQGRSFTLGKLGDFGRDPGGD
jgi:hypothetical protein